MNTLRLCVCISIVFATAASAACSDSGDDSSSDDGLDSGSTEGDGDASTPTEGDGDASTPTDCTPIPDARGTSSPAAWYCADLGYEFKVKESTCQFGDGTECNDWDFFYGKCGQAHSFCEMHGGKVTYETGVIDGSPNSAGAMCTLPNGKRCLDYDFARTCVCE